MIYTVIGLILDIIGAWLIAYEFIWGYPKMYKVKFAEARIKALETNLDQLKKMNLKIPTPPYTKEEIEGFQAEAEKLYAPWISEQQAKIQANTTGHKDRAFLLSLFGLLSLTIGFVLQIIGAVNA